MASTLGQTKELAVRADRPDLVGQLQAMSSALQRVGALVVVAGEFDTGKSSLVNGILLTEVCPQDADEVTVVPTLVTYGDEPSARAHFRHDASESSEREPGSMSEPIVLGEIASYVAAAGNPRNRRRLASVEVRLPHRVLKSGLSVLDTPGVGGLDSGYGAAVLAALDSAVALVFVTDAGRELTATEVDFLRNAAGRVPRSICVATKIDLHPAWRRIVDLDAEHVRSAGLTMPVIGVSSQLRMSARRSTGLPEPVAAELTAESGFAALFSFLADAVVQARAATASRTAADATFVTGQLSREIEAEDAVLQDPRKAAGLLQQLTAERAVTQRLRSPHASWQQALTDGAQDLVADVEYNLEHQLRTILAEVEEQIDAMDPRKDWSEIELAVRRATSMAAVSIFDDITARATDLATRVAETFELDLQTPIILPPGAGPGSAGSMPIDPRGATNRPAGRLTSLISATRMATFVPMAFAGAAGGLIGTAIAAPLSIALAIGIGGKMLRDERGRQLTARRAQARHAVQRYLFDEVRPSMGKQVRDALRTVQRGLRDEFTMRAATVHRSTVRAAEAVERAATATPDERAVRAVEVHDQAEQLRRLARQLVPGSTPARSAAVSARTGPTTWSARG